jgi:serine/threonine protein kinase
MGEVYLASDSRLHRKVAVKILPSHLADDVERRERFEREARVVAGLNQSHICTVFDIGAQEIDGGRVHFLVMEYLQGETLAQRLKRGALPLPLVLRYAIDISEALAALTRAGWCIET